MADLNEFTVNEIAARVLVDARGRLACARSGDGRSVGDAVIGSADVLRYVLNRVFDETNNTLLVE